MNQHRWHSGVSLLPNCSQRLQTTSGGLTNVEAQERLERYGSNLLRPKKKSDPLTLLLNQFKSPIILILLFAAGLSFFLQ